MCWTDFDIDSVQIIWKIPWKGVMHLFEVSAPFNKCISFKMVEHAIEVGHVLVYFYVKNKPSCTCNGFSHDVCLNEEHVVYVST